MHCSVASTYLFHSGRVCYVLLRVYLFFMLSLPMMVHPRFPTHSEEGAIRFDE